MAKAGRIRLLAVSSAKRSPAIPDVPTIAETVPGYEFLTWHVIMAPKGTPRSIVTLLNDRLKKLITTPEQVQQFAKSGVDVIASTPEEAGAHLRGERCDRGHLL